MIKWLKNLWNLNKLLYKLQLSVDTLGDLLDQHQIQLEDLRQAKFDLEREIKKLKSPIPPLDVDRWAAALAKVKAEEEAKSEATEEKPQIKIDKSPAKPYIIVEEGCESKSEPFLTTRSSKYYDPQMGVEYYDFEINGDKVSPDEDTVKE